ncbi:MAG: MFS transporter [Chloroflexota bacterium]|nr:MFS transporter [Chloroflexota bacterium]
MASSGPAPPSRPPGHGLGYLLLTLHLPSMAIGLGLGLTVPVIPELTQQMGIDLEGAALVFVFQLLGTFAAPLPTGFLIDKIGRRRVLLAGPIITGVASLLVAKVALDGADGSFVELLIYRFIAGWGEQMWTMSRITVIADTGASNQRGKQVTQMFGVQQIGNLSGPIVGGFAAVLLGLWAPFVMHAAIVLLALIPSFYLLRETAPTAAARQTSASGERPPGAWRQMTVAPIPAVFVVQFLANVTRGGVFGGGVIVVYAAYAYGLEPDELGVLRGAMAAVAIPIVFTGGYVMDRFGRKYTIVPGLVLSSASMVFLAGIAYMEASYAWFVAGFIAIHMSANIISGNMQTLGTDVAPTVARGTFFGVSRTVAQGGMVLSPASFGWLTALSGATVGFGFLGATAFVGAVIVISLIPETLRREEPSRAASSTAG